MTMIGSPACPLGRLEGHARGGGEGEGRCRLSSPPPKGGTPCDRPPRGAILIPRPLGVVDYSSCAPPRTTPGTPVPRSHVAARRCPTPAGGVVPGSRFPRCPRVWEPGTGSSVGRELDETVAVIGQFEDAAPDEGRHGEGNGLMAEPGERA